MMNEINNTQNDIDNILNRFSALANSPRYTPHSSNDELIVLLSCTSLLGIAALGGCIYGYIQSRKNQIKLDAINKELNDLRNFINLKKE